MENLANIQVIQNIVYIVSSVMFILGIKMLGKEATAVKGNYLSALAMFSAVGITCLSPVSYTHLTLPTIYSV